MLVPAAILLLLAVDHSMSATDWVLCHKDNIPNNAVVGGTDRGEDQFVGRAWHEGGLLPGKVIRRHQCCFVAFRGREHRHKTYEILVSDGKPLKWVPSANGHIPKGAIRGGVSAGGETLYIGRARHSGTLTLGKIHPSHGCLYIPYGDKEHRYNGYEILVDDN